MYLTNINNIDCHSPTWILRNLASYLLIDLLHKIHLLRLYLCALNTSTQWFSLIRLRTQKYGQLLSSRSHYWKREFLPCFSLRSKYSCQLKLFFGRWQLEPFTETDREFVVLAIPPISRHFCTFCRFSSAGGGGLLDYPRKFHDSSLPANKVDCSASKNLRKPYIFTQDQRSEIIYWPRLSKHLSRLHQTQGHALQRLKEPCDVANRPFLWT